MPHRFCVWKSLNIVIKHVFICSNPYIYTTVDDVEGLAVTKHLELLKQKDEAEGSFIIEKIVGKLLRTQNRFIHIIFLTNCTQTKQSNPAI